MNRNQWLALAAMAALMGFAAGCSRSSSAGGNTSAAIPPATVTAKSALPDLGPEPDVTFQALNGQSVRLSDLRGKVVLVNFWATWCEPCRAEIPELIEFQRKYGSRGFTVLGVAMDQEGRSVVAPFVAKPQFEVGGQKTTMDYPIVLGDDDIATKFGGFLGLPTSYVISKEGKVVQKILGPVDDQAVDKLIQQML
ncbi:MAG TPA: TlpA disulfide reductase family protein [Candidatus Acidoferrales bacterium]|nr:TlpA disulfide reductase family protein [Candidatus Acidoferrales bacterium]